jgi:cytoskeleton protein RodZ
MAKGNFGERLKRERELREVSLGEITAGTRIGARFLEALENEQWEKLPGGVFNRGFVRAIAHFLGLDEEDLLAEYDLAHGEQKVQVPAPYENRLPSRPLWVPAVAILFIVVLLAGMFYAGRYGWRRFAAYRAHSSAVQNSGPAAVPESVPQPQPAAPLPPANAVPDSSASLTSSTSSASARAHARVPAVQNSAPVIPEPQPAAPLPPTGAGSDSSTSLSSSPSSTSSTSVPASTSLTLSISTSSATRVRILADNKLLFDAEMPAGENRQFLASNQFIVTAADSSAVLLELNGRAMPPLGMPGSSGTIVLSRKNLR